MTLYRELMSDGSYKVWVVGDNMFLTHWVVCSQGVVRSVQCAGNRRYQPSDVGQSITALTGVPWDAPWAGVAEFEIARKRA